jgi:hypothetical protein
MTVRKAFEKIFAEMGEKPTHISTDQVLLLNYVLVVKNNRNNILIFLLGQRVCFAKKIFQ